MKAMAGVAVLTVLGGQSGGEDYHSGDVVFNFPNQNTYDGGLTKNVCGGSSYNSGSESTGMSGSNFDHGYAIIEKLYV